MNMNHLRKCALGAVVALALCAAAFVPAVAFAGQNTQKISGDVVIKLQGRVKASSASAAKNSASKKVTCKGRVIVKKNGKAVKAKLKIINGTKKAIRIDKIKAPKSLSGWKATAPKKPIKAKSTYKAKWTGEKISSALLKKLKSKNGKLKLSMKVVYHVDAGVASTKGCWLAAAGAQDPTAKVIKTMTQIEADAKAIKSGNANVIAEYNKYLANDSVHLYARWRGSTVDLDAEGDEAARAENGFVEFRIIQVGAHDNEDCALTFQATHLLPEALCMNADENAVTGWPQSELYTSLQPGGSVYKNFDSAFTDKILTVSKATAKADLNWDLEYSQNKFWLLSFSEFTGQASEGLVAYEGSQYRYWADQNISANGDRSKALIFNTRAGNHPANLHQNALRWWERSPMTVESWLGGFLTVNCKESGGTPVYGTSPECQLGVALAFCL